ncbi:MAG: hypothetical protein NTV05_06255 [Acidobacteria bacterium]|nr:hypothetical protein [Acidobacteriota bacterium]
MRPIFLGLVVLGQALSNQSSPPTGEWVDSRATFKVDLRGGFGTQGPTAILTIENTSSGRLDFPTPFIMPLAGPGQKNNVRIYRRGGQELEMWGPHVDWVMTGKPVPGVSAADGRPLTSIEPGAKRSWTFALLDNFPQLRSPGDYDLEFLYFNETKEPGVWQGRVEMTRIPFQIR